MFERFGEIKIITNFLRLVVARLAVYLLWPKSTVKVGTLEKIRKHIGLLSLSSKKRADWAE